MLLQLFQGVVLVPAYFILFCSIYCSDVLLTVHLSTILATDQLNAQIVVFLISLSYSSTCFEHCYAHHQMSNCIIQHLVSSNSVGGSPVRKHVEEYNKLITKTTICSLSWSIAVV